MSSDYSPSSSRRPRRNRRRPGGTSSNGSSRHHHSPQKPQKTTLWQKITSFFVGKSAEAPARQQDQEAAAPSERSRQPERSERKPRREESRTSRPPVVIEVTSARLYVGNLSFDATESDLEDLFSGVGSVVSVEVVSNRHTQRSKGFGFVQMQSIEEAKRAVAELHDKEYMGRKLLVSGAKAQEERRTERAIQPEQ